VPVGAAVPTATVAPESAVAPSTVVESTSEPAAPTTERPAATETTVVNGG
jgi:hypothetical protein